MLSGYPPFDGKNNIEIFNKIRTGKYSFDNPIWKSVSDGAKNLITNLLCPADRRLTASQSLEHDWIQSLGSYPIPDSDLIDSLKGNLKEFHSRTKLHRAITNFIGTQVISSQETRKLRELFKSLDTNGDGKLSKEELLNGFNKEGENQLEFITYIMNRVDTDRNGYIDLDEFLVAAVNQNTLFSRENMKKAFDMFDLDGSGKISYEELQTVLGVGNNSGKSIWLEIINKAHKVITEEINFQEFCEIIESFSQD